jgi:hypothetical protein
MNIIWLLERIKNESFPTRRNIFRGCYDVWCCEQDRIDAVKIPKQQLVEAESLGLIYKKQHEWKPGKFEEWFKLTPYGEQYLEENQKERLL